MQLQIYLTLITIPNNVLQGDVKTAIINTGRLVLIQLLDF